MNITQEVIKRGDTLVFSNHDNVLEAWFDADKGWMGGFKIWFNGTIIHSTKTFKPFESKLEQMVAQHNLKLED